MLGIDLRESEYLTVSEGTTELIRKFGEILLFFGIQGKTFALVVFVYVGDVFHRSRSDVGGEKHLIETGVVAMQHRVKLMIAVGIGYRDIFFDTFDAGETHVLGYLHGIGAPGSDHFFSRATEIAGY